MGMFSEGAIEHTILCIVCEIKKELDANKNKSDVRATLKKIGRFALTQFDYSEPAWAKEYQQLFNEPDYPEDMVFPNH